MPESSLKDKTVKGIGWSAIDNVAQYAVHFVVSIVLARILSPDDYGLIGIVAIFTSICTAIVNGGFSSALIRKKDATEDDFNTAFIVNIGLSLLLYVLIFLLAPYISVFFRREELTALTRVSSIGIIIGALAIVQQTKLTRRIDFKTQTVITLIASIISGIIGIVMSLTGFGVWSLVVQVLSSQFLRTISLWFINRWVPKFRFVKKSFQDLFGYGWKIMVSGLLDAVWKELYQVVVGKFYSPATLGQYTRANQFSNLFSSNLTTVIQRVTFPVLSTIQDDTARMIDAYRRIIKITMFVTVPCMFLLAATSEPLIYCLIGPKWHEAASYLPLICIMGSLYPLHAINLNMLQVQGRSDLFLILEIVKKVINVAPLLVGAFVGIFPMLYTAFAVNIIAFFLNSYFTGKQLGYSSFMQIKDISFSYIVSGVTGVIVWLLHYLPLSNWLILPLQMVLGVGLFYIICITLKPMEYDELKKILLSIKK